MFSEPGFAIVAINETVHRLVCSVDLHLDEACLVASALLALEQAFVFWALRLDFFVVPVSAFLPHAHLLKLLPLFFHLFTRHFSYIESYELFWTDLVV